MTKLRVYACGGCGINLGKKLAECDSANNAELVYVDSSESNMNLDDSRDNFYAIEGMDGAGKLRATTYKAFKNEGENVLINYPPSKVLNVIISSLSGGSGSIIAPLITHELLSRGETVLVIAVASTTSGIEIKNSINTLHTYNHITQDTERPVAMLYCDDQVRSANDKRVVSFMELLSLITDRTRTKEFDTADLANFINYNLVTSLEPAISLIEPCMNNELDEDLTTARQNIDKIVASTILASSDPDSVCNGFVPEYYAKVLITDPEYNLEDIRIDNVVGRLPVLLANLETRQEELDNRVKSAKINEVKAKKATDGFMVL